MKDAKKEFTRNVRQLSKLPVERQAELDLPAQAPLPPRQQPAKPAAQQARPRRKTPPAKPAVQQAAQNSGVRRSSRLQRITGHSFLLTCLCIMLMISGGNAVLKSKQIKDEGLVIHHSKTVVPTRGKVLFVYTSDLFLSKVWEDVTEKVTTFDTTCAEMRDPRTWQVCRQYAEVLNETVRRFLTRQKELKSRVKRSWGLLGNVLHFSRSSLLEKQIMTKSPKRNKKTS